MVQEPLKILLKYMNLKGDDVYTCISAADIGISNPNIRPFQ